MIDLRVTYIGGPTAILELGETRFLTDPTFDPAGTDYPATVYTLHKTQSPAIEADAVGRIDAALLSHDHHFDNLDNAGRAFLERVPAVYTTTDGADRVKGSATGMTPWDTAQVGDVTIVATPARHGPPGGDRGPVIGFALTREGSDGAVYVSGDTVWYEGVEEVLAKFDVRIAVLNLGAAKVAVAGPMPLTFTAADALAFAKAAPNAVIVPLHYEGWRHFSEGWREVRRAFADEGLSSRLRWLEPGKPTAIDLTPKSSPPPEP